MSLYASELRRMGRELARVNRRLALAHLEGVVAERDETKWKVRLELGTDEDGKKILSPWLKPFAKSSGAYADSPALPEIGDPMRMMSPSGVVGAASYAIPSTFDETVKRPEGQGKDESVRALGKTRMSMTKDTLTSKTEKVTVTQTADGFTAKADKKAQLEGDEVNLKGKTSRLYGDSIDKVKIIVGGQAFHITPTALLPTTA